MGAYLYAAYPTCCLLVRFSQIGEHQRCCARRDGACAHGNACTGHDSLLEKKVRRARSDGGRFMWLYKVYNFIKKTLHAAQLGGKMLMQVCWFVYCLNGLVSYF